MTQTLAQIMERTQWFRQARFGMFLHWGLYSIPARGEWVLSHDPGIVERYPRYLDCFNPEGYQPKEWARQAKAAGMQYMILTAKHHDGFCLFDSQWTDYKATNTPCGRDLVGEFVDAARAEGLKVGLYYSLLDWHHPDYPHAGDPYHPRKHQAADPGQDFNRYVEYMHRQVEELVTQYGRLDILWFDFSYGKMCGQAWRAQELIELVRGHQPWILIDNRLETSGEGFGSIVTETISDYAGDFVSPEQVVPHEGIRNEAGNFVPWELCLTMNNNWAYHARDHHYKSSTTLIHKLVECVAKEGNMLLNIGPTAQGRFPAESQAILRDFSDWMDLHSESIYGCGYADLPKPDWGYYTRKGQTIYAHLFEQPIGPLYLPGIDRDQIKRISWLNDGSELQVSDSWNIKAFPGLTFVQMGEVEHYTYLLPNQIDAVLKIELKD